jgi:hypothetical protein
MRERKSGLDQSQPASNFVFTNNFVVIVPAQDLFIHESLIKESLNGMYLEDGVKCGFM